MTEATMFQAKTELSELAKRAQPREGWNDRSVVNFIESVRPACPPEPCHNLWGVFTPVHTATCTADGKPF